MGKQPMKGLYIFFEGYPRAVIDSQVLRHVHDVSLHGPHFEVWSFACTRDLYKASKKRLSEVQKLAGKENTIRLFRGIRLGLPFSEVINAFILAFLRAVYRPKFSFVHARTEYSTSVAGLSIWTKPIIWDCRGDALAEYREFRERSKLGGALKEMQIKWWAWLAKRLSSGANFVVKGLSQKFTYRKPREYIGCYGDASLFYFDKCLREKTRSSMGFSSKDRVLLYSGSFKPYQGTEKIPLLLECLSQLTKAGWKLLIVTMDRESAEEIFRGKKNVIITTAPLQEVNAYLNAADLGFLLREACETNRYAFPTKFSEYVLAGLPVLYSSEIGDLEEIGKKLGLFSVSQSERLLDVSRKIENLYPLDSKSREYIASRSKELVSRDVSTESYLKLYKKVIGLNKFKQ